MLDTTKIIIPQNGCNKIEYELFGATRLAMKHNPAGHHLYVNVYNKHSNTRLYLPKASILKQGSRLNLLVECSAPKILFDNNTQELNEADFDKVVDELLSKLAKMGAVVDKRALINSEVIALHVSKNILLNKSTPQELIRKLSKIDNPARLDINHKSYTNNGEALQFYAANHGLVIYDKEKDAAKAKIRSIDKFKPRQNIMPPNILRLEARLNKKRKLNAVLKRLGFPTDPRFKDVFNSELCKMVLLSFWDNLISGKIPPALQNTSLQTMKQIIFSINPRMKRAIYLTGLLTIINDCDGIGGLRSQLKESYPHGDWRKIKADINELNNTLLTNNENCLAEIEQQLKDFQPIDLTKYYYDSRDQKRQSKDSVSDEEC